MPKDGTYGTDGTYAVRSALTVGTLEGWSNGAHCPGANPHSAFRIPHLPHYCPAPG
jgi:hypothetical protein